MSFNQYLLMAKEQLPNMKISAYCQTCGKPFLEISGEEYVKLSRHLTTEQPDKWFIETGIHWVDNEGHLILIDIFHMKKRLWQESITKLWDNKLAHDRSINRQASRDLQRPYFFMNRELCKDLPI